MLKFEKSLFFGHPCDNRLLPTIQCFCHMLLCRFQDRICLLCRVICCCVIDTTIDTLLVTHAHHSSPENVLIEKKSPKESDHKFIKYNLPTTDFGENLKNIAGAFSAI